MQFQVPQFIEVEDKIFGPLTFKQFIYIIGGAGASYLLWRLLPIYASMPLILITAGLATALAFLQWNGRPFIIALESGFYYLIHTKLYLWNNTTKPIVAHDVSVKSSGDRAIYVPKLSESKLHELAWSLDIKERIAAGTASEPERTHGDVLAPVRTAREALTRTQ
jgi:hypothetical protein